MLDQLFHDPRSLGMAQAAIATLLALGVMLIARRQRIHLERETLVALVRGFVQIVLVGSVLLLLLQGPLWTSIIALLAMIFAAASIAARRAKGIPGAFWVSLHRFTALIGHCLDPGLDGRYDSGEYGPCLRRHLPIRRHRHDLCGIWPDVYRRYAPDPFPRILAGSATNTAPSRMRHHK